MKNIFKKKEVAEGEEEAKVELTPEEKKAKRKKFWIAVGTTTTAVLAGAACVLGVKASKGKDLEADTDGVIDDSVDAGDIEEEVSVDTEE